MLLFGSCVWVRPVFRRNMACFGCSVVRLLGCSAVRLLGCSAAWLFGGTGGTDGTGGAVARRIAVSGGAPVAVRRFCAVPGLNPLSGSAFRVHFPNPPFGPAFRARFPGLLRACSGSVSGLFRDLLPDRLSGPLRSCFRACFRGCRPDTGAILFDCGMWCVVPIRPQDSSV